MQLRKNKHVLNFYAMGKDEPTITSHSESADCIFVRVGACFYNEFERKRNKVSTFQILRHMTSMLGFPLFITATALYLKIINLT